MCAGVSVCTPHCAPVCCLSVALGPIYRVLPLAVSLSLLNVLMPSRYSTSAWPFCSFSPRAHPSRTRVVRPRSPSPHGLVRLRSLPLPLAHDLLNRGTHGARASCAQVANNLPAEAALLLLREGPTLGLLPSQRRRTGCAACREHSADAWQDWVKPTL